MSDGEWLLEAVTGLLRQGLALYRDNRRATDQIRYHLARLQEPLRIAVAGPWRSGKSTLINAIIGEEIAPVRLDGGRVFTWYEDGPAPQATAYSARGRPKELVVTRSGTRAQVDVGGLVPDDVLDIVVRWPTRVLRHATLIESPSTDDDQTAVTARIVRDFDAVLYLARDARGSDLQFLRAIQEGPVARSAPVNVMLVLSRADEVGGGRIDALITAKRMARSQRRDPQVSPWCVNAVALGGLIGLAGRLLDESDFAALAALAALPRAELDGLLLSADRFVNTESVGLPDPAGRRALLDRLGLFGVRLSATLIRTGCDNRAKLANELIRRSGLTELRESMGRYFIERREVLKARSALAAVDVVLRADPRPGSRDLLAALERILATTHDFRELRLLATLRDPQLGFDAELAEEAHRILGGSGTSLPARLGVDHDTAGFELSTHCREALTRWQHHAEDGLLSLAQRRAAQVVVRSCEGMLIQLSNSRW